MSEAERPRRWPPFVAGAALLALFVLKMSGGRAGGVESMSKCGHDEDDVVALMALAELASGTLVLLPSTRRLGAFAGLVTMTAAAGWSLYAGLVARIDMKGCRCFGAFDAPWWVHFLVAAVVAVPLWLTLSDASARRRLVFRRSATSRQSAVP